MPTVVRTGPYRLFFYSSDAAEPAHIHIERDDRVAKLWMDPVQVATSRGFRRAELRDIERLVRGHREIILEAWRDFFDS